MKILLLKDYHKKQKDLLEDDFRFNKNLQVELGAKKKHFEYKGKFKQNRPDSRGHVDLNASQNFKYGGKGYKLEFEMEHPGKQTYKAEIDTKDVCHHSTVFLDFIYDPTKGICTEKVHAQIKRHHFFGKVGVMLQDTNWLVNAAISNKIHKHAMWGFDSTYDLANMRFTKYDCGIAFKYKKNHFSLEHESLNENAYEWGKIAGHYFGKFKKKDEDDKKEKTFLGSSIGYDIQNNETSYNVCVGKKLSENLKAKAKIDQDGLLGLTFISQLDKKIDLITSFELDGLKVFNEKEVAHKFGFGLNIKI